MENMMNNARVVDYVRKIFGIVAGVTAGILGLTGFQGFAVYVLLYAAVSVLMLVRMQFELEKYIPGLPLSFAFSGIGGQVLTFVCSGRCASLWYTSTELAP